jgi:hypothetical protein
MERAQGLARSLPGAKIAAVLVWLTGLSMTAVAVYEMTFWPQSQTFFAAIVLQLALTLIQSDVWIGRGGIFPYSALAIDTTINFGGVMALLANVDNVGSVQAITATFLGYQGDWPMIVKGALALAASALIAGLPEFLWKKG